jgi:hypothetical protein
MGRKGRPTKYVLSYEQKVWDNYNPYNPPLDPRGKQLEQHYDEKKLLKMEKAVTQLANLAGYEANRGLITSISKRLLDAV